MVSTETSVSAESRQADTFRKKVQAQNSDYPDQTAACTRTRRQDSLMFDFSFAVLLLKLTSTAMKLHFLNNSISECASGSALISCLCTRRVTCFSTILHSGDVHFFLPPKTKPNFCCSIINNVELSQMELNCATPLLNPHCTSRNLRKPPWAFIEPSDKLQKNK